MGKNLIQQRKGKGSSVFRFPGWKYRADVRYTQNSQNNIGTIVDLVKCPAHTAPLAKIRYENGEIVYMIASEGIKVGDTVNTSAAGPINNGNVLQLSSIPEGTLVFNIESQPGDGGKFVRAAGTFARIVGKYNEKVSIQLPSKKIKEFHETCRATVGVVAGHGRLEKPILKAGARFHAMKARNKYYPEVGAIAMNAVCHPFGGSRSSKKNKTSIVPRFAPAGRKVGLLRPRRVGRTKR